MTIPRNEGIVRCAEVH